MVLEQFNACTGSRDKGFEDRAQWTDSSMDSEVEVPIAKLCSFCGVNLDLTRDEIDEPNTLVEFVDVF